MPKPICGRLYESDVIKNVKVICITGTEPEGMSFMYHWVMAYDVQNSDLKYTFSFHEFDSYFREITDEA